MNPPAAAPPSGAVPEQRARRLVDEIARRYFGELPFMVSRKIEGHPATTHPQRIDIVHELGSISARLHRARTHGFGPVFDWSGNRLSRCDSWGEYLDDELDAEHRIAVLAGARMLDGVQLARLREAVEAMRGWRKPPVLHHGDLRLKNVVVDAQSSRIVALIDWEDSVSAPAPCWDLSIALHDLNMDEKQAFLDGYGMTPRAYAGALPFMRAINSLNYARAVSRALRKKDHARLAWYRARMGGGFDLFVH
jgi:hygromycin-B 4-O-kinase